MYEKAKTVCGFLALLGALALFGGLFGALDNGFLFFLQGVFYGVTLCAPAAFMFFVLDPIVEKKKKERER